MRTDPYARMALRPSRFAHQRHVQRASCVFCRGVYQASLVPAHVVDKHKAELAVLRWPVIVMTKP